MEGVLMARRGPKRRLDAESEYWRLVISRETVEEILDEGVQSVERPPDDAGAVSVDAAVEGHPAPLGVVTVPRWRTGMKVSVLPQAYRDAVEIVLDAGGAMPAGRIVVAMGMPDPAAKREGLRSKLKRLVERGWLSEDGPGLFAVAERVARQVAGPTRGERADGEGIGSSPAG
jgi:hypothetical protein